MVVVTRFVWDVLTEPLVSYLGMTNANYANNHELPETVPVHKKGCASCSWWLRHVSVALVSHLRDL